MAKFQNSMNDISTSLSSVRAAGFTKKGFMFVALHNQNYSIITCSLAHERIVLNKMQTVDNLYPDLVDEMDDMDLVTGLVDHIQVALVSGVDGVSYNWLINDTISFTVPDDTFLMIPIGNGEFYALQAPNDQMVTFVKQKIPPQSDDDYDTTTDSSDYVTDDEDEDEEEEVNLANDNLDSITTANGTQQYLCYEQNVIKVSNQQCNFQGNLLSAGFVWNRKIYLFSTDEQILVFDDNLVPGAKLSVKIVTGADLLNGKGLIASKGILIYISRLFS